MRFQVWRRDVQGEVTIQLLTFCKRAFSTVYSRGIDSVRLPNSIAELGLSMLISSGIFNDRFLKFRMPLLGTTLPDRR